VNWGNVLNKYYAHIDGLRGISIIAVVFSHMYLSFFSAGFIGVDYFFVISGYLITSNIVKELKLGSFSFLNFYYRRARRILPAIIVMYFSIYLIGIVFFYTDVLFQFSKSLFFSSLFSSNILFYFQAGYFDSNAYLKPLLHTWSLSVEEQFYFIWPTLLFIIFKIKNVSIRKYLLIALAVLSYASMMHSNYYDYNGAFYLIYSRMWQFIVGALFAITRNDEVDDDSVQTKVFSTLSVIGLIAASIYFTKDTPVHIYSLACLFVIPAIKYGTDNKFLNNKILVFIGKISYSLYLWHWIGVVITKYYVHDGNIFLDHIHIVISIILSVLSYKYIETPFRKYSKDRKEQLKSLSRFLYIIISLVLISITLYYTRGYSFAYIKHQQYLSHKESVNPLFKRCHDDYHVQFEKKCEFGKPREKEFKAFLVGDSHASHYVGFSDELLNNLNIKGYAAGAGHCFLGTNTYSMELRSKGFHSEHNYCKSILRLFNEKIQKDSGVDLFIIAERFELYTNEKREDEGYQHAIVTKDNKNTDIKTIKKQVTSSFEDMIIKLVNNNKKILLMGQVPNIGKYLNMHCVKHAAKDKSFDKCGRTKDSWEERYAFSRNYLIYLKNKYPKNVYLFLPDKFLCNNKRCTVVLDDILLYKDDDHLNDLGSRHLFKYFDVSDFRVFLQSKIR
jgi:peptidoglycan/LPS O-acetylase OafA/YrhL